MKLRFAPFALLGAMSAVQAQVTTLVSVTPAGVSSGADCKDARISGDGRFVVFDTLANGLDPADVNNRPDIYIADTSTGAVSLVSVNSNGEIADAWSFRPAVSRDGRFVVFDSLATNLIPGALPIPSVYVRDRTTNVTELASIGLGGAQGSGYDAKLSADGRLVLYSSLDASLVASDTNGVQDVFLYDRGAGTTERVNLGLGGVEALGGDSGRAVFTPDARFVVFDSLASNLTVGASNPGPDLFLRDRQSGVIEQINVSSSGVVGAVLQHEASLSADGRFVAFLSSASNLVVGDTNGFSDVFVRDRLQGTTTLVSTHHLGWVSRTNVHACSISADGGVVAFSTYLSGLVGSPGPRMVWMRNMSTGFVTRASISDLGVHANGECLGASLSSDGARVAFWSAATNLTANDATNRYDVYLHELPLMPLPRSFCTAKTNSLGCVPAMTWSGLPSATAGGGFIIGAQQVLPHMSGALRYALNVGSNTPFQGGFVCAAAIPSGRTRTQFATPTGLPPCSGEYAFDFNAYIAAGGNPFLIPGQRVVAQYWSRDPGSPGGYGLSDGLDFTVLP